MSALCSQRRRPGKGSLSGTLVVSGPLFVVFHVSEGFDFCAKPLGDTGTLSFPSPFVGERAPTVLIQVLCVPGVVPSAKSVS